LTISVPLRVSTYSLKGKDSYRDFHIFVNKELDYRFQTGLIGFQSTKRNRFSNSIVKNLTPMGPFPSYVAKPRKNLQMDSTAPGG